MVFRKRKEGFVPSVSSPVPINILETQEELRNNALVHKEVVVTVTPQEFFEKYPIPFDDFTISQELQAGVPLKDVSSSSLLDSKDNLDYDVNDIAEERVFEALTQSDNKE